MLVAISLMLLNAAAPERVSAGTVVFVCEHGNVKSLMAREWFNRRARERGMGVRAVARGITPDSSVPAAIGEALRRDGFDVAGFEPRALAAGDLANAARVVAIGVGTPAIVAASEVPVESWDGVPPATERYESSRDVLRGRIEGLITTLEAEERRQ